MHGDYLGKGGAGMPEQKGLGKPILTFADAAQFDAWLEEFHGESSGIRLRIAKKGAAKHSIAYEEALECALRWGWIDSRKEKADEDGWLQHFTPRRSGSVWSRINRDKAERLIAEGRMRPPRPGGGRRSAPQRPVGQGLREPKPHGDAGGFRGRAGTAAGGPGFFRRAGQPEPVRDAVSRPSGPKAGDESGPHPRVRGHA
ncbi:hypothetical protein BN871_KO_00050 [Paenibacillus sp. P22]|nr:hypothetical protein BN871_KO_00050 [Paenibacillus sp. P22]